jgi:CBS domain-containing protein
MAETKVKDMMTTNPLTVNSFTSIKEVSELFDRIPYWAIFVVDSNKLLGVVTRNDLRIRSCNRLPSDPISQIMSTVVFKIDKEEEVERAVTLLNYYNSNSLAVTSGERLCGIITRYDIETKNKPEDLQDEVHEVDSEAQESSKVEELHEKERIVVSEDISHEQEYQNNEDNASGLMKTCSRCHRDMGKVNGLLDGLFHATGSGLCDDCRVNQGRQDQVGKNMRKEFDMNGMTICDGCDEEVSEDELCEVCEKCRSCCECITVSR